MRFELANYKNRNPKTNKTKEDFRLQEQEKKHAKLYHEIMPSLDQKIPWNTDEISSSKQVKYDHFFCRKFSTSIALERETCSFEPRQSSILNLPLPTSHYSNLESIAIPLQRVAGEESFGVFAPHSRSPTKKIAGIRHSLISIWNFYLIT